MSKLKSNGSRPVTEAIGTFYLSGPMSGYEEFNFPAFKEAVADLRSRGLDMISPHELDDPDEVAALDPNNVPKARHAEFLSRDVALLCDPSITGIVVLPGWEKSRGARLEVYVGRELGKAIMAYPNLDPVIDHPTLLEEANNLIHGARGKDYGHPIIDFTKQAKMMSAATGLRNPDGSEIRPDQIPLLMICVKLSRLEQTPDHFDSMLDIAGYAGTWEMVKQAQGAI